MRKSLLIFASILAACATTEQGDFSQSPCLLSDKDYSALLNEFRVKSTETYADSEFQKGAMRNIKLAGHTAELEAGSPIGFYGDVMPYWEIKFDRPCNISSDVKSRAEVPFENIQFGKLLLVSKGWKEDPVEMYFDFDNSILSIFNYPNPYEN